MSARGGRVSLSSVVGALAGVLEEPGTFLFNYCICPPDVAKSLCGSLKIKRIYFLK